MKIGVFDFPNKVSLDLLNTEGEIVARSHPTWVDFDAPQILFKWLVKKPRKNAGMLTKAIIHTDHGTEFDCILDRELDVSSISGHWAPSFDACHGIVLKMDGCPPCPCEEE